MQRRSIETRKRIMNAALECFSLNGYEATGVADICLAAGKSKGAFYHHFDSKQALFSALLEDWLATIDVSLEASRHQATSIPQALRLMSELMTNVFTQAGGRLPIFLEFMTQANHDPIIWHAIIAPYKRYAAYFNMLISQGIQDGSIKSVDPDVAARTLVSLALGLLLQGLLDPQGAAWDNVTRRSIDLLLDGLQV